MIAYDPSVPLIFIHVPKCAGRSVSNIFRAWFGDQFYRHYYDERAGKMPQHRNLADLAKQNDPSVIYGHFNRHRNFGVEDYYSDAQQFMTILRDPYEICLSTYFYTRKVGDDWKDQTRVPRSDLETYLRTTKINMLEHFPRPVTQDNYKDIIEEFFIDIGTVENLADSLHRAASKLNYSFNPKMLENSNVTARNQIVPAEMQAQFRDQHPLEYAVYDYAAAKFATIQS